jgi:hypothetical protein
MMREGAWQCTDGKMWLGKMWLGMHARARFPSSTQHDTNIIVDGDTTQGIQGNTRSYRGTKPDRCTVSVRKFGTPMLGDTRWLAPSATAFSSQLTRKAWQGCSMHQCLCAVGPRGKGGCLCIRVTHPNAKTSATPMRLSSTRGFTHGVAHSTSRPSLPTMQQPRPPRAQNRAPSGSTLQLVGLCPQNADTNADAGRPAVRILPSRRSWPGPSKAGGERAEARRGMRRAWCDVSQQDV